MEDPAAMRRRLRVELKRLRTEAAVTQREVAEALDWSPSKIIRIESGQVGITVTDLKALVGHYGLADNERLAILTDLAKGSKRQPFADYRGILSAESIKFMGYEASASRIRQVQTNVVPGLMQIEEYTRALLTANRVPEEYAERIVDSRRERQELLERDPAVVLDVILDECVLRREVGGVGVMRNQVHRLLDLSARGGVSIRVVPFEAGAYEGLRGPFVHLEFPEASDPDVLYLEYPRGPSTFTDDPAVAAQYQERYLDLEDTASKPEQFAEYAERAIRAFSA